jgi:hypothetical protein
MGQYQLVTECEHQSSVIDSWSHLYSDREASLPDIESTCLSLAEAFSRF